MSAPFWTDRRAEELMVLRELVSMAGTLNNGSNICEKIRQLEIMAGRLRRTDFSAVPFELSFLDELSRRAIEERSAGRGGK